ncbi:MAG: hypothetical protein M1837_003773 [Sclerophora amabilis]|nr:MAG: hypothetical protein M1837_003773 [Sclerophora amabilis]
MELLLFFCSVLVLFTSLATANPLPEPLVPPAKVCSGVNTIVSVLKLNKATPFCSSFISITPVTKTQTSTAGLSATTTVITTQVTAPRIVNTVTVTDTVPTTVEKTATSFTTIITTSATATSVQTDVTTLRTGTSTTTQITTTTVASSVTTTVAASPATTTVYTRGPLRRDDGNLQGRAVSIPPYVSKFASSALSNACSCLSLTTPTTTKAVTVTNGETVTVTATSLVSSPVSATETVTATVTSPVTSNIVTIITETSVVNTIAATTVVSTVETELVTTVATIATVSDVKTATVTGPQSTVTLPYPSQVVKNPSFEEGDGQNAPPWTGIFSPSTAFSFLLNTCGSTLCGWDGTRYLDVVADPPGGTTSIKQRLQGVEPGIKYNFSVYVGFYNGGIPSNPIGSSIRVTLDGVEVVPQQPTCETNAACQAKGNQYYGFRQITGSVTPTSANPELELIFTKVVQSGTQTQDTLVDSITLTRA